MRRMLENRDLWLPDELVRTSDQLAAQDMILD